MTKKIKCWDDDKITKKIQNNLTKDYCIVDNNVNNNALQLLLDNTNLNNKLKKAEKKKLKNTSSNAKDDETIKILSEKDIRFIILDVDKDKNLKQPNVYGSWEKEKKTEFSYVILICIDKVYRLVAKKNAEEFKLYFDFNELHKYFQDFLKNKTNPDSKNSQNLSKKSNRDNAQVIGAGNKFVIVRQRVGNDFVIKRQANAKNSSMEESSSSEEIAQRKKKKKIGQNANLRIFRDRIEMLSQKKYKNTKKKSDLEKFKNYDEILRTLIVKCNKNVENLKKYKTKLREKNHALHLFIENIRDELISRHLEFNEKNIEQKLKNTRWTFK